MLDCFDGNPLISFDNNLHKDEWDISALVIKRIGKNLTTHKALKHPERRFGKELVNELKDVHKRLTKKEPGHHEGFNA